MVCYRSSYAGKLYGPSFFILSFHFLGPINYLVPDGHKRRIVRPGDSIDVVGCGKGAGDRWSPHGFSTFR